MANSAVVGVLRAILTADTGEFDAAMKRVSSAATGFSKDLTSMGRQASQLGASLTRTLTVPLVGIGVTAAKLAIDFESSFAGVRKTVDATEPEFEAMAQAFRNMSKEIPISVNDFNRLGEAAGALGIPKKDIVDFARVMALLGVTTNVTADQAAESIAQIQNIFGAAGKDTDRFGATLVALGNDGAATESQILEMATRIAGAGNAIGLTQGQVLGFASALSSVGLDAEAGGSAISRVFITLASSVSKGGKDLEGFARVSGMSASAFAKAFKEDAAGATTEFIKGLSNIKQSGGDLIGTLTELGFSEVRVRDTLLRAAGSGNLLTKALELQEKAWRDNSALTEEAGKRFATMESQLTVLWNRAKDVGITLGIALLPAITAIVKIVEMVIPFIETLARGFAALPEPIQLTVVGFLAVMAAAGPVLFIVGQLITAAGAVVGAFTSTGLAVKGVGMVLGLFGTSLPAIGAALATLGTAFLTFITGPIGLTVAAVVGLGLVWVTWGDDITRIVKETYAAVKMWLWDKFEPVLMPIIDLLDSVGEMFEAFGDLVGAVAMLVVRHVKDLYEGVKEWLLDRLRPVITPINALYQSVATKVNAVKDLVIGYARMLYEGVKTWLLDRFTAIVDGIKAKVDAVTGVFRGMYDAVVGNSIVPDMITRIGEEFGKLAGLMVSPVESAVGQVKQTFSTMLGEIESTLDGWGSALGDKIESALGGPIGAAFGKIAEQIVSSLSDLLMKGIQSVFAGGIDLLWKQFVALASKIIDAIKSMGSWLKDLLGGGGSGIGIPIGGGTSGGSSPPSFTQPPQFATGGIVTRPTLAMIGESGPEAVIPLSRGDLGGTMTIIMRRDGRDEARWLLPFISGARREFRLA